ncbi:MAG: DivIVA domain-containing protein [Coriobacteriia bacterium]|nr:DivIVA domain-containing protein [Coriobacteriia bacterium]MCL2870299.1 DivIVA domain-containing protein [Coriobacteriia bacterium]
MKITSMDVHRKEFGHAVRGYREDEVDDFLDAIAVELDRLQAQIEELADHARQSESQAMNFEAERNTINNALLTAQRASDEVLEQAKEKSRRLLEEADARAEKTLLAAKQERELLLEEIGHLKASEEKFRADVLSHAQETIDQLKVINAPRIPKRKEAPVVEAVPADVAVEVDYEEIDIVDTFAEEEQVPVQTAIPVADSAPAPVVQVQKIPTQTVAASTTQKAPSIPASEAPEIKKEEGIGQFGEMELDEDLETID